MGIKRFSKVFSNDEANRLHAAGITRQCIHAWRFKGSMPGLHMFLSIGKALNMSPMEVIDRFADSKKPVRVKRVGSGWKVSGKKKDRVSANIPAEGNVSAAGV